MKALQLGILILTLGLAFGCRPHNHEHNGDQHEQHHDHDEGENHGHDHDGEGHDGHDHDSEEHEGHDHEGANMESDNQDYDPVLAQKLKADEYGMGTFVIAFLKTGPNKSPNKEAKDEMQAAHMANMNKLAEQGKLVMAGPFFDDPVMRGLYIFDVETVEEAKALTETDPMIQNGILVMELKKWYGSAGLREMNDLYYKIAKTVI